MIPGAPDFITVVYGRVAQTQVVIGASCPADWRSLAGRWACHATVMKYALFYESADDVRAKAPAHFPAHKARYEEFHARGDLLMLGVFEDPQRYCSMAIFTTREAAEEFAAGDPFVTGGVVRAWHVRGWNAWPE
jgi:uncharacterized protein